MSYGYKNDEICKDCNWKKTGLCDECYNHMKFQRKQELINKFKQRGR